MTTDDTIKLARKAILHTLRRIQSDKDVAYKFGPGSASYEYLTAAASVLCGQPLDEVQEKTIPGSSAIPHSTAEELLADL